MNILPHALAYARKGWRVLPLWWPAGLGVCACPAPDCKDPGKHPLVAGGAHAATTRAEQIEAWWRKWPQANVGIATGEASGIWVLDIDVHKGGGGAFRRAYSKPDRGRPVPTVTSITGSGGRHVIWRTWGAKVPNAINILPGVDLRGDGGLIVAPPSLHGCGERYRWHPQGRPGQVAVQSTPQWVRSIVDLARNGNGRQRPPGSYTGPKPQIDVDALPEFCEGERNRSLFRTLCRMIWEGRDAAEVEAAAHRVNNAKCKPPLPDREVAKIVNSAERYR